MARVVIEKARQRRELANNPAVSPKEREVLKQINTTVAWEPTTTTTS